jgi:hypothetical protein
MNFFSSASSAVQSGIQKLTNPSSSSGDPTTAASRTKGISNEFQNDNPVRMPTFNTAAQMEAARLFQNRLSSRSGRTSTALVNAPGTTTYAAPFLGSTTSGAK